MNKAKLQIETLKEMLNNGRSVRCFENSESGETYITFDGLSAFSIPTKDLRLDVSKMNSLNGFSEMFEITSEDVEVNLTNQLIVLSLHTIRELKCETFSVYADTSLFGKYYDGQKIYCKSPMDAIKLFNPITGKVEAIVLPFQVRKDETA